MDTVQELYKDTRVGRIPMDWNVKNLIEVFKILDNKRKPLNSTVRNSMKGEIPYYGANGCVDKINDFIFNEPLILMAEDGGNYDQYQHKHIAYKISGKSWVNNHAHVLKPNPDFNFDYVFYELEHKNILRFINGSTRTKLNQGDLKLIPLKIPPLNEQKKIAEILSTVDEQISLTEKIIEKSKELKKGLMQKLFSEGIGHTEFKDTKIGKIPKEWEVVKIGNIGTVIDSLHQTPKFSEVGYPMVRVGDINKSKLNLKNCLTVSLDVFKTFTKNHLPTNGDILITRVGSFGKTILVEEDSPFCLGQNTAVISGLKNERYVYYMLNSYPVLKQIGILTNGSTQPSLSLKEIRNIKVAFGSNNEQNKIAAILSEADAKIEKEHSKKEKLEELKRGLMQQLLTGKKRVKV